ncbi:AMP-binding protein [Streptomyces sp. NPDC046876]|uniref:class I adenylate-forming enzyme family protein n=1 Tax=Streptomyces sp. NPDC046876 TaxID=3155616 RepID=UPI0033C3FB47
MWMTHILERNRSFHPDRTALADERRSVTWAELENRVENLAGGLLGLGVRPGDRVAVLSKDRIEVLETYFALARIGAAFVPLNHGLTRGELTGILDRARVGAIIGEAELIARAEALGLPLSLPYESDHYAALARTAYDGPLPDVHPDDILALFHTSATTGHPKAVVLSHRSLMNVSLGWLAVAEPTDDMVMVNACPLFHGSFGMSVTYLAAGATVVLMPGFTPQRFLRAVETHRATHAWLVPEMLGFLLRTAATARTDLSSLREIMYGAAPMPVPLYRDAARTLGCGFRQVYGMTEVGGSLATLAPGEHPSPQDDTVETLPTGRPVPGMSVRIVDRAGRELPAGEIGEVCVRGDDLMRGYWADPGGTAKVIRGGWLHTGDLGLVDARGYLWLTDRIKDVIIRGGQNIYPAELERVLRGHPAVADAAVVAVPDADWGQLPLAYVVRQPGADCTEQELLELLVAELAPYKRPRGIRFIDTLPTTASGKVLKRVLRELAEAATTAGDAR